MAAMPEGTRSAKAAHPGWMLAAGAALLAVLALAVLGRGNACEFVLINQSDEIITRATVQACGQKRVIVNLLPGQRYKSAFSVNGDSHYTVKIVSASGKELHEELGYITGGFDYRDFLTVTRGGIILGGTHQ